MCIMIRLEMLKEEKQVKSKIQNLTKMIEWLKKLFNDLGYSLYLLLVIIPVLWGVLYVCHRTQGWNLSDTNLIITFLGVLATFVVVSNFSQVTNIENKTKSALKDFEQQLNKLVDANDEKSQVSRLKKVEERLNSLDEKGKYLSATDIITASIEGSVTSVKDFIKKEADGNRQELEIQSLRMLRMADALINSSYKDILTRLMLNLDAVFRVTRKGKSKKTSNKAHIRYQDDCIKFVSTTGKTIFDDVMEIDGIAYSSDVMDEVLIYIIEATNKTRVYKPSVPEAGNDDQI